MRLRWQVFLVSSQQVSRKHRQEATEVQRLCGMEKREKKRLGSLDSTSRVIVLPVTRREKKQKDKNSSDEGPVNGEKIVWSIPTLDEFPSSSHCFEVNSVGLGFSYMIDIHSWGIESLCSANNFFFFFSEKGFFRIDLFSCFVPPPPLERSLLICWFAAILCIMISWCSQSSSVSDFTKTSANFRLGWRLERREGPKICT